MSYKILASDFDGTLAGEGSVIPELNKEKIKMLPEKGVHFVLCSGRSHMSSLPYLRALDLKDTYGISFNGGVIYKVDNLEIIYDKRLENEIGQKLIESSRKYNIYPVIYVGTEMSILKEDKKELSFYVEHVGLEPNMLDHPSDIKADYSKILFSGDIDCLRKFYEDKIAENEDYNIFFSNPILLEVTHKDVSKGNALKALAEYLNVDMKDTIAIGDNFNDISMIQQAGLGVCVENGEEDVKKIADYVTNSSSGNGAVAEVIDRFILKKP